MAAGGGGGAAERGRSRARGARRVARGARGAARRAGGGGAARGARRSTAAAAARLRARGAAQGGPHAGSRAGRERPEVDGPRSTRAMESRRRDHHTVEKVRERRPSAGDLDDGDSAVASAPRGLGRRGGASTTADRAFYQRGAEACCTGSLSHGALPPGRQPRCAVLRRSWRGPAGSRNPRHCSPPAVAASAFIPSPPSARSGLLQRGVGTARGSRVRERQRGRHERTA